MLLIAIISTISLALFGFVLGFVAYIQTQHNGDEVRWMRQKLLKLSAIIEARETIESRTYRND